MSRYSEGELVLVHQTLGKQCVPPLRGTVEQVYQPGQSVLFDCAVRVNHYLYGMRDAWLAPVETTICEAADVDGRPFAL